MRIVVHQVRPHVARADGPQDRVHVGAVEVKQGTPIVEQCGNLADLRIEQPNRVGVGDHEHSGRVVELASEVVQVDQPARIALDGDGLEPRQVRRGGVRAVGAVGDEHLGFAARAGRRKKAAATLQECRRQLALASSPRPGRKLYRVQTGDLGEHLLQLIQDREQTLKRAFILGTDAAPAGPACAAASRSFRFGLYFIVHEPSG